MPVPTGIFYLTLANISLFFSLPLYFFYRL